ncbi:MAG: hypothetical protein K8F24_03120, partial [Bacteroidales bacterium]|nr:hypothetical protein [Bacteroidales bacterium]
MKNPTLKKGFVVLIFLVLLLGANTLKAQTFEEFQQQIEKEYTDFEKETQQQFDQFVAQIDAEFADFLATSFKSFEATAGKPKKPGPKPKAPPKFDQKAGESPSTIQAKTPAPTQSNKRLPNIQKAEPGDFRGTPISFDFYGASIKVDYDPRLKNTKIGSVDPDGISEYWLALSESYYNHLLKQLREFQTDINLNDFATLQLIQKTAKAIQPNEPAHQALLAWFLLTRSRFLAKIAYHENQVFVLLPSLQTRYGENFVLIDNRPYYLPSAAPENIKTYSGQFPEADIIP